MCYRQHEDRLCFCFQIKFSLFFFGCFFFADLIENKADEKNDGQENEISADLLIAFADDAAVYHEDAAGNAESGQDKAFENAKVLTLCHQGNEHGDIHGIKVDDGNFIGFPTEPHVAVNRTHKVRTLHPDDSSPAIPETGTDQT